MSTIISLCLYVIWRLWEDRKARIHREEISAKQAVNEVRLERIEEALSGNPFLNIKLKDNGLRDRT